MLFWRMDHPEYDSDYRHSYINGSLEHPFGLPGVKCERCRATWGGGRVIPYELPQRLRSHKHLIDGWPISDAEHAALRAEVLAALRAEGAPIESLEVGARFQPAYLDIPSRPQADFLWAGLSSVVVSQRVRNLFVTSGVKGCSFIPVTLRKVGRRSAKLQPPMPTTGEPDDLIHETVDLLSPNEVPSYYELVISATSAAPPGGEPRSVCPSCGRETIEVRQRELVMNESMWRGHDVFHLATTLWIIVTNETKVLLESLRPTNVVFTKVGGLT